MVALRNNSPFLRFPHQKTQISSDDTVALYFQPAPQDLRSRYLAKLLALYLNTWFEWPVLAATDTRGKFAQAATGEASFYK